MIDGKPVIYGYENEKNTGCNIYRIRQPMEKIMDLDLLPANTTSNLLTNDDRDLWFKSSDIVFTQRAKYDNLLSYIVDCRRKRLDKKFVMDYDDNIFAVSPYSPSYFYHGLKEVDIEMPSGERMEIRDGKDGFDIEANKKLLATFGLNLKFSDMVITPSPVLSGFFKRFNKNTVVIKNFLDFGIWNPIPLVKDERVRLLWQGGESHFGDWGEIEDALIFVMNKYAHVDLVIFGSHFTGFTKNLPQSRVFHESWVDILAYPYKVKTLNADIGLAPIENNEFNTCKSELKWTEYSALEIPCVASNIPPYSLNINDGKDGFLAHDVKDWIDTLSKLIESKELRQKIGKQARERVKAEYDIDKNIHKYTDAFLSLYKKELIIV